MDKLFSNISLTIVDVLGVLLPGAVWTILIFTLGYLVSPAAATVDVSPWHTVLRLCSGTLISQNVKDGGVPSYVIVIIISVLAGLVVKPVGTRITEWICFAGGYFGAFRQKRKALWSVVKSLGALWQAKKRKTLESFVKSLSKSAGGYRFPYNAIHERKAYFKRIYECVQNEFGYDIDEMLGMQPFICCKHLLLIHVPLVREDILRREAESRMQGSLFPASVFSSVMAGYAVYISSANGISVHWLLGSLAVSLALMISFRRLRRREVGHIYLEFLYAIVMKSPTAFADAELE